MTTFTHLSSMPGLTEDELSNTFKKCLICPLCPPERSAQCSLLSVSLLITTHHYPKAHGRRGWVWRRGHQRSPGPCGSFVTAMASPLPHGNSTSGTLSCPWMWAGLTSYLQGGPFPPRWPIALLSNCTLLGCQRAGTPIPLPNKANESSSRQLSRPCCSERWGQCFHQKVTPSGSSCSVYLPLGGVSLL